MSPMIMNPRVSEDDVEAAFQILGDDTFTALVNVVATGGEELPESGYRNCTIAANLLDSIEPRRHNLQTLMRLR